MEYVAEDADLSQKHQNCLLFEVDALFYNDDRHLNNIALIEQDEKNDYCPIFDNGAGLLCKTTYLA